MSAVLWALLGLAAWLVSAVCVAGLLGAVVHLADRHDRGQR